MMGQFEIELRVASCELRENQATHKDIFYYNRIAIRIKEGAGKKRRRLDD